MATETVTVMRSSYFILYLSFVDSLFVDGNAPALHVSSCFLVSSPGGGMLMDQFSHSRSINGVLFSSEILRECKGLPPTFFEFVKKNWAKLGPEIRVFFYWALSLSQRQAVRSPQHETQRYESVNYLFKEKFRIQDEKLFFKKFDQRANFAIEALKKVEEGGDFIFADLQRVEIAYPLDGFKTDRGSLYRVAHKNTERSTDQANRDKIIPEGLGFIPYEELKSLAPDQIFDDLP